MKPITIGDYRKAARARLPKFLFEYIDGGSLQEETLARNVADLKDVMLRQRIMRDVSTIDTSTSFFGQSARMPLTIAPIGMAGMYARRGEVKAVQAAGDFGVPFTLSTMSVCSLQEVAQAAKQPFWFQLYMIRDRAFMAELLARAAEVRCSALVFTVDMPVAGLRYRDRRTGLAGAPGLGGALRRAVQGALRPQWAMDVGILGGPHHLGNVAPVLKGRTGLEDFFGWIGANFDPRVTWADLAWVRERWKGPIIIKGILDPDDAKEAVKAGANGIIISNHGGRQLDGVSSTVRMVAPIREAVGTGVTVLADSGVRTGLDVIRMMALGADGVMIGRAWVYALAARGRAGVSHILELFEAEMRLGMALAGVARVSDINQDAISGRPFIAGA